MAFLMDCVDILEEEEEEVELGVHLINSSQQFFKILEQLDSMPIQITFFSFIFKSWITVVKSPSPVTKTYSCIFLCVYNV